tara:strand:+ start:17 stop:400 length:384 start_codon:yes stop_codon:yes gene_type:complete
MSDKKANPVGRPTKYKPEYCQTLIDHMESGLSYECFAGVISVSKQTLYDWEKVNPEFIDAKKIGLGKAQLYWEKVGNAGMYMGGKDNPFNSTIWIFNMKNRFNWRDKQETTHDITEEAKKLVIDMGN